MPYAAVNGIRIFYESHGEGPAIVFAHGRGGNHLSWWQQVPVFARAYRCIVFAHRGFGLTADGDPPLGRDGFVDDLGGLLDTLGIERTFLVAQSMGGWTALNYAARDPARISGLVLADTTGGITDDAVLAAVARHGPPPTDLMQRVLGQRFRAREPSLAFLYRQIEATNPPRPVTKTITQGGGVRSAELKGFPVPTLCIVGTDDTIVTPEIIDLVAAAIPGATSAHVPDVGHSVYFEAPEAFNRLVAGHLARCGWGRPEALGV